MFGNPKSSTARAAASQSAAASRSAAARSRSRRTDPRRNATLRHWAPAVVTVLAVIVGQLFGMAVEPAVVAGDSVTATSLAPHLRTVALGITDHERPPLRHGELVDVHGVDGQTGFVRVLVEGAVVTHTDASRIVVAVDQRDATILTSATALGRVHVVGR